MFKFCINRKIFNFFNRKENNFVYRLTSYRLIRILGKRFVKRFASDLSRELLTQKLSPVFLAAKFFIIFAEVIACSNGLVMYTCYIVYTQN